MSESMGSGFSWTEEQWERARKTLQDSARRARVASSFLPLHGPLPPDQISVSTMAMEDQTIDHAVRGEADVRLEIRDEVTIPLTTISTDIYLRTYEAADPDMAAALEMIGRAADVMARVEDSLIFTGQPDRGQGPSPSVKPEIYTVKGGAKWPGLLDAPGAHHIDVDPGPGNSGYSSTIVAATVEAIEQLERVGHYGPFAQVLGNDLYLAANTPNEMSMVLPSDRMLPFLDGPLLRSSTLPSEMGVVVGLGGAPVDLVVAQDLHLKFVQMSVEPRYILRLSERFTLRIKQSGAVAVLTQK